MGNYLDMSRLATMIRAKRGGKGLREVVKEIGDVSPSTLSRIENVKVPDIETFLQLCDWLKVPPVEFLKNNDSDPTPKPATPEAIEIQLRADSNLDPATANALATIVKAAYHDLIQQNNNASNRHSSRENNK